MPQAWSSAGACGQSLIARPLLLAVKLPSIMLLASYLSHAPLWQCWALVIQSWFSHALGVAAKSLSFRFKKTHKRPTKPSSSCCFSSASKEKCRSILQTCGRKVIVIATKGEAIKSKISFVTSYYYGKKCLDWL